MTDTPKEEQTTVEQFEPEATAVEEPTAESSTADEPAAAPAVATRRSIPWERVFAYGVVPALALVLAVAGGYLFWRNYTADAAEQAREDSVAAARSIAISMLTYEPQSVEQQLGAAKEQLTGTFRDTYSSLIDTVVVPGAKERQISAVTDVPAAASVSAEPDHAVVLLFVNQTVTVGSEPPTNTASSVRVTLDKVGDHWRVSEFQPI
ncbi:UNVERIFIED_ORG: Mce-associated membrane protein [Mycolicibacterium obuense]|uniref:Twin-arginine translocation pathway signal n=3 Tax=unclassified Mycobacterium TaxID=2642494 RepID=A0A5Q5BPM1_MYCSS